MVIGTVVTVERAAEIGTGPGVLALAELGPGSIMLNKILNFSKHLLVFWFHY